MRKVDGSIRKLRRAINAAGHAHELPFCCYQRLPLLSRDRTRTWFLEALDLARRKHDLELWAYVIMPEHAHILFRARDEAYDVSLILKTIKQSVSRRAIAYLRAIKSSWLDRLKVTWPTGRVEYRFWQQGGGFDRSIIEPGVAAAVVEYLHNNPVRRGLATLPADWPWSSARWYAGMDDVRLAMDAKAPHHVE